MERIIVDSVGALHDLVAGRRVIALCDRRVAGLYDLPFEKILVDAHEECKTLDTVERVAEEMIARGVNRDTFLLGVGGGVVCDIAGFVAAIYMRGLRYGLVPTTLLAQADAATGGKNGVNIGGYKNILGTFGEPEFVLCDVDFLHTLPERELRSGMAEVLKAAVIGDPELFAMLERGNFSLGEVVERSVAVKVAIVSRDRHENGERRLLNLGHTVGHAIEKVQRESAMACEVLDRHTTSRKSDAGVYEDAGFCERDPEDKAHEVSGEECTQTYTTSRKSDAGVYEDAGFCERDPEDKAHEVSGEECTQTYTTSRKSDVQRRMRDTTRENLTHGEAVSVGLVTAAAMAVQLGMLAPATATRIEATLKSLHLPTATTIDPAALHAAMHADKKNYADGLYFVLPTAIGTCTARRFSFDELSRLLDSD